MKQTVSQYARMALLKLRVLGENEVVGPKAIEDIMVELAFLIDTLNAKQLEGCFSFISRSINLESGTPNYSIGPGSLPDPLPRPINIIAANINYSGTSDVTTALKPMSIQEYNSFSLKTTNRGIPTRYFYNPSNIDGEIFLYPAPADSSYTLNVTYKAPIAEYTDPGDYIELQPAVGQYVLLTLALSIGSMFNGDISPADYTLLAKVTNTLIENSPMGEPSEIMSDLAGGGAGSDFITYIPHYGGGLNG